MKGRCLHKNKSLRNCCQNQLYNWLACWRNKIQWRFDKGEETVTKDVNVRVMESVVKPYVFQQDGAPVNRSQLIQNWPSDNVDMFWSKEMRPPNSTDLNPLDYYVWSVVERNKSCHSNAYGGSIHLPHGYITEWRPCK